MEFNILNEKFEWLGVIDFYISAIWTNRYSGVGDFEIYTAATENSLGLLREDYFISREDDDMVCVIERVNLVTDSEGKKNLIVTGRSLSSILGRRIVWKQTMLRGTVEDCIRRLLTENAINPVDSARKIPGLILGARKDFTDRIETQFTGDNLLEVIMKLCESYKYGFNIIISENNQLVFELYAGEDRSYSQEQNPHIVFSPEFDNLKVVDFTKDKTEYKNVALVAGEGEGLERKTVEIGKASGFSRYEMFVDARDISTNNGAVTESEYNEFLLERGNETLALSGIQTKFDGEIEALTNYVYKTDYFLGDIIQIENEFGIRASSRIIEIIECTDENGYTVTPTFENDEV